MQVLNSTDSPNHLNSSMTIKTNSLLVHKLLASISQLGDSQGQETLSLHHCKAQTLNHSDSHSHKTNYRILLAVHKDLPHLVLLIKELQLLHLKEMKDTKMMFVTESYQCIRMRLRSKVPEKETSKHCKNLYKIYRED